MRTFVPSERLFSSSGHIVSKTRAALLPVNVTTLVCLRDWQKAWQLDNSFVRRPIRFLLFIYDFIWIECNTVEFCYFCGLL